MGGQSLGRLDDLRRLKDAALAKAKSPETVAADLNRMKDALVAAAKDPDTLSKAANVSKEIMRDAIGEAGLRKRNGEISKLRVAKAIATPALSGRTIIKGAAKAAMRQAGDQWGGRQFPESEETVDQEELLDDSISQEERKVGLFSKRRPLPGPEDPEALLEAYRSLFKDRGYEEIYNNRCQIWDEGENITSWEEVQEWQFWLNALPAVAGLRIGIRAFPITAFCGYADNLLDRSSRSQVQAANEIQTRYHGEGGIIRTVPE